MAVREDKVAAKQRQHQGFQEHQALAAWKMECRRLKAEGAEEMPPRPETPVLDAYFGTGGGE